MNFSWFVLIALIISFLLTAVLRRYALARSLMDIPNARSSHTVPTPRGGGVAIVVTFLVAMCSLYAADLIAFRDFAAIAGAGSLVAIIGFMDDHGHIAARWRLLGHFCAAIWALAWLGGLPPVSVFGQVFDLGWGGFVLASLYLVWMLNLYNFMDGIDGIAGVEAVTACVGACVLYALDGHVGLMGPALLLAGCAGGFLLWNFPPAKIFMGDAGSGFLGIVLGILSIQAANASFEYFWGWLILLGVFIVDATFTLLRRLLRGEKVYEAHRSHAYQFASRRYGKHLPVTLVVGLINVFWLLPIAVAVTHFKLNGFVGAVVAYVPLFILALRFRAGKSEKDVAA
ncbi:MULTISPECIES: glycosyltransferase family 4 protein [unclassified Pseudomonas]|uniref:MraY family glycosyltransferase n=1 Tax=unclassified Pseudomonas TaxID=196821 RepID=UPI000A1F7103|nr:MULTISPECIES: glycosyltransferase family 4 protein [unclassified Pseudomonas]MBX8468035.1 glycosyltransferase family 4 protein [Pseudomonas sp. RIT778]UVM25881.1 glycosyltransferase family 4 protein [Pseudomonas sp. B21-021]